MAYFDGIPYSWCHDFIRYYGTNIVGSGTTSVVSWGPLCPEDYKGVNVVPPTGGTYGNPYQIRFACEAWTQPSPTQAPPDCCGVGNPIIPEDATKRQTETDYQSPNGRLTFSRSFNSAYGGFFHNFQTPVRTAYDLGQFAAGTASVSTGCLSSRVRIADSDGTIRYYPHCFTYLTEDATQGRIEVRASSGLVMQFTPAGAALDPWNAGTQLAARTLQSGPGWALIRPTANSVDFYDASWRLTRRQFADGKQISVAYTGGLVRSISDEYGRSITLGYDAGGHLASMTDPAGRLVIYSPGTADATCYGEGCQQIASVTYQDGASRTYQWNETSYVAGTPPYGLMLLTGVTDESGQRFATFTYSGQNAKSTERAGSTLRYEFTDVRPGQTTVKDPLGTSRTYSFQGAGGLTRLQWVSPWCANCLQSVTYDTNGNPTARSDFNNKASCYAYDLSRNLETKRVEGVSQYADCTTSLSSPPAGSRVISTQWHPDWRLETKVAEPNKLTTIVYNGQGATCAPSTVLVDGKPPAVVCIKSEQATTDASGALGFAAGLTGTPRTWNYTYTTYGRVLTATDPNGKVTTTTYYSDDDPDMGRRGNVATVTNAANHVTRFTAYNLHGQPTQIVDPNGLVTDLTYDLRLRLTSRKAGNELTTFSYEPTGLLKKVTLPDQASVTYTYDAAHRLVAINDQQGNRIDYTLDAMGNRISEKAKDSGGTLVKNIQRTIDALNRVQQVTGAQ